MNKQSFTFHNCTFIWWWPGQPLQRQHVFTPGVHSRGPDTWRPVTQRPTLAPADGPRWDIYARSRCLCTVMKHTCLCKGARSQAGSGSYASVCVGVLDRRSMHCFLQECELVDAARRQEATLHCGNTWPQWAAGHEEHRGAERFLPGWHSTSSWRQQPRHY